MDIETFIRMFFAMIYAICDEFSTVKLWPTLRQSMQLCGISAMAEIAYKMLGKNDSM